MITTQQLFELVTRHLITQDHPAVSISFQISACVYRGVDGDRCAIGCLIDDQHYKCSLEGKLVNDRWVRDAVEFSLKQVLTKEQWDLLADLQQVHDYWEGSAQEVKEPLLWVCDRYRLAPVEELVE